MTKSFSIDPAQFRKTTTATGLFALSQVDEDDESNDELDADKDNSFFNMKQPKIQKSIRKVETLKGLKRMGS